MTPNRSLEISASIREIMRGDILQFVEPVFPQDAVQSYTPADATSRRDRSYSAENTLLTMVVTALQPDRSLTNSVEIYRHIHNRNAERTREEALVAAQRFEAQSCEQAPRKRGRPRTKPPAIPKSKMTALSSNTAAYSKARARVEQGLIDHVFAATRDSSDPNCVHRWHGRTVFNTDGTYFQLQDTDGIPEKYRVNKKPDGELDGGYPQALLQIVTQNGTGAIYDYCVGGRDQFELDAFSSLLKNIPPNSLLLADALYDCYAMYCALSQRGIDIIVPDKRGRRKCRVIEEIAVGDEIVELKKTHTARKLFPEQVLSETIKLRRITYPDTQDPQKTHAVMTSILDKSIDRTEIVQKYRSRWDIEVTIREIKTVMGLNIVRAKSEAMVFREIGVAMIAYNLVRKIITKSALQASFPPKADIFQILYSHDKNVLVDKKGRVYSRWSPGRPANNHCAVS